MRSSVSRVSHEARGLKYRCEYTNAALLWSRLSRGAWIKILNLVPYASPFASRLSRGAWIKMNRISWLLPRHWSRLSRGAWIKMYLSVLASFLARSRLSRGAWIKIILLCRSSSSSTRSRLSRGAWIKISQSGACCPYNRVASLTRRVD